jgi:hypothetical protein
MTSDGEGLVLPLVAFVALSVGGFAGFQMGQYVTQNASPDYSAAIVSEEACRARVDVENSQILSNIGDPVMRGLVAFRSGHDDPAIDDLLDVCAEALDINTGDEEDPVFRR